MNPCLRVFFSFALVIFLMSRVIAGNPSEGLDSPASWTSTGTPAWDTVSSSAALAGGDVARTKQAGDSAMETVVSGPATVAFSWRLSGPDGRGWLSLKVDGQQMATLRRALVWQEVQINLPPGSHTIRIGAHGMARVPGAAAEADRFVVSSGARLAWLTGVDEDSNALWVTTGPGQIAAEQINLSGLDDGKVVTIRGTGASGRTSLVRLVQGPARLVPRVNVKGGIFTARDLDSNYTPPRRVSSAIGDTWNAAPIIVGPGLHRVEWVHFYWAPMEDEKDPYPQAPPANLTASPADVATLASLTVTPLAMDSTIAGGLTWTSSGTNPFVPTLAARDPNWPNADQMAALGVERPDLGEDAKLSTVITGPAEVSLRLINYGPSGDLLRVLAGGEVKYVEKEEGTSGSTTFEIPAGPVTVEIEWSSGFEMHPLRSVALTGVEVRQPLPGAVRDAIDAPPGLTFYTPNPELWDTATADPRTGTAARTRPFPLNPLAFPELSGWVEGPAVLSYWRRADLPAGASLPFPGVMEAFNPGPFTWQFVTAPVPEGRHRLVWYSPSPGQGFFGANARYYLDGFSVEPGIGAGAVSLAEALDTPGRTWTSSGNDAAGGSFGQLALDGIDAVALSPLNQETPAWVETTVTGPALVAIHSARSTLGTTLDGAFPAWGYQETSLEDFMWTRTEFSVPPGEHVLRLAGSDPRYPLMLDMVEITPQPALSVDNALDAPGRIFTSSGDRWLPLHSVIASDGDGVFASGAQGSGWLATDIEGPARVEFEWQAGPEYTRLSLEMDGAEIAVIAPYQTWEPVAVEVPAGVHSFRWVFSSPENRRGAPAGLNGLSVTPLTTSPLAEALDTPGRMWLTSGPLPEWTLQTEWSHDGQDAAYVSSSEDDGVDGGKALQTVVTGPALVRFWWYKDGPGMVFLQLDGRNIAELTDEDTWQEITAAIPAGSHVLKWTRFKNHFFEPRPSFAVDEVRFETLPEGLTLGEVLDAPALTWRTSESAPWEFAWRQSQQGAPELAAISPAAPGETTWIETDVTGPAVLSFLFLEDTFGLSEGSLLVDGVPVHPLRGSTWPDDAAPVRWPIPAGPHTIRWHWTAGSVPAGSTTLERVMVDRVEVATDRPAIGTLFPAGVTVDPGSDLPWTVQPAPGGGFRAESQAVLPGGQSVLRMSVPGGSEVAFRSGWTGLRSNRMGGNFLSAGGAWHAIHGLTGYEGVDTLPGVWHLPAGSSHDLRWTVASGQGMVDSMFLDQVSLTEPEYPLADALGVPQKVFFSTGSGRWHGQATTTHGGGSAVSSGGSGSLISYFTGPGTVSWSWKGDAVSPQASVRLIAWYIIPTAVAERGSSFDWEHREAILPWAATYRLEWKVSGYEGGNLFLDRLTFRESVNDTYTAWAIAKLIGGERAVMDADPDGDGQSNLMEFAFGSDPNSQRSAYRQDLRIEDGQIRLCLTRPDHDTTGLNYDLEFSSDLQEWELLRRIPGGPSIPDEPVTCAVPAEVTGDHGFVRLRLSFGEEE